MKTHDYAISAQLATRLENWWQVADGAVEYLRVGGSGWVLSFPASNNVKLPSNWEYASHGKHGICLG